MVTLSRIYTRSGDKGKTSLGDGTRVVKHSLRVEAYGSIDEANAVLGLARLHTDGEPSEVTDLADAMLGRIQQDLFDLGADLCTPFAAGEAAGSRLRIVQHQVDRLEAEIDTINAGLAPLDSFVLPGGTALAAHLHHGRTVVRRAERLITALAATETVNPLAVAYANRLSDLLFVLARLANHPAGGDVLWLPGTNR
jgi:cob(I)alamin adenosyltransferase